MTDINITSPNKANENTKQHLLDLRYLRMARIWSENSYCQRRKVGALVVKNKMIISDGYNGTPSGFENVCETEDNVTKPYVLHAEANALVVFSDDFMLYPILDTSFEGLNTRRCQSPLSANGAENIAITGHGVFDGSGDSWRPVKKGKIVLELKSGEGCFVIPY